MALGRIIRPKVYIEGVEIPCYKVVVQTAIGGPATAQIDVPPVEEFFDRFIFDEKAGGYVQKLGIQPRSLIHVFYEDSDDPDGLARLLFEGEFVRYEYSKTTDSRFIKLVAMDVSNVLSSVYVRYYSDFMTPYGNRMSVFTGQSTPNRPNTENLRLQLLAEIGINPEIMTALQNDTGGWGIAKAIRDITVKALKSNTFFSGFDSRTKISSKIVTFPDTQSKKLLEATQLASMLQQNMASLKESATIWDLYTMLMSLVFYYPTPITSAPYIKDAIVGFGSSDKGNKEFIVAQKNSLASMLMKPMTWWTAPPNFNVIFPSQFKSFSMGRDFLSEPTRLIMSAFGVIESTAQEELKRVAPTQFTFVAPRALAQRWDYETHEEETSKSGHSVGTLERSVNDQLEKKRVADIERRAIKTTPQRKLQLDAEVKKAEESIAASSKELQDLFAKYQKSGLKPITEASANFKQVPLSLWNRNVLTAQDGVSLESREDIKGIIFSFDYMSSAQVEVTKAKGISPNALKDYLANVADYKLSIQQHQRRTANMSMVFSPQLTVGFPTLIVDPVRNFFGELDVITHILDAQGIADTQVQVSFVRNNEMEFSELSRNGPGKVAFPAWLNPLYLPSAVGTEIYAKLFPANKPSKSKPGIKAAKSILTYASEGRQDQIAAADRIRKLYFAARDHDRFASGFTRRNIASIDQVFVSVMGATKAGANYIFNAFDSARYQAATAYAKQARKVQSFAGADSKSKEPK